jgi:hypothetical protein
VRRTRRGGGYIMSGCGTINVDGCRCISSLFLGLYLCVFFFFYLLCFYGVAGWVLIKVFYVGTLGACAFHSFGRSHINRR